MLLSCLIKKHTTFRLLTVLWSAAQVQVLLVGDLEWFHNFQTCNFQFFFSKRKLGKMSHWTSCWRSLLAGVNCNNHPHLNPQLSSSFLNFSKRSKSMLFSWWSCGSNVSTVGHKICSLCGCSTSLHDCFLKLAWQTGVVLCWCRVGLCHCCNLEVQLPGSFRCTT